jgi:hypothetical protein
MIESAVAFAQAADSEISGRSTRDATLDMISL